MQPLAGWRFTEANGDAGKFMMRNMAISTGKIVLFFVVSLGLVVGYVAVVAPGFGMVPGSRASATANIVFEAIQLAAMLGTASMSLMFFDRKAPVSMGLAPRGMGVDFATGTVVGVFIFLAALAIAFYRGWARLDLQLQSFSMAAMAVSAVTMSLHAAMEEVMMRGYVLQELMSKFSTTAAVVASSILFVALHAGGLVQDEIGIVGAANIFLASVLMSVAYLRTKALWLPIGIHAGWNFTQGPLLGINVSGNDFSSGWHAVVLEGSKWVTGGKFGFEASVPGLLGPALGIVLIALFFRRQRREEAARAA